MTNLKVIRLDVDGSITVEDKSMEDVLNTFTLPIRGFSTELGLSYIKEGEDAEGFNVTADVLLKTPITRGHVYIFYTRKNLYEGVSDLINEEITTVKEEVTKLQDKINKVKLLYNDWTDETVVKIKKAVLCDIYD